ncbi:HAUS augmin-like complex subunit 1 [Corythoichthys intestinalis]|uniref:HAUS augmin-like complex subunit 1 n=1 Tax=Corythoichthys intestinalis TaxID=161448 RepID=UPI0025A4E56B|nr:HAUS augmin-like complex subunit 1 [Corythoichthys intestinalis]XP_061800964.1 HAUS augmin-like complex subunit 1 [Nerophis lumbriciformis]
MSEKIQRGRRWLASMFGDLAFSQLEVNARTMDILDQLARSSDVRCRHICLLAEDINHKAAEYGAEGAHLQEVIEQGLDVSSALLSKSSEDLLSSLADNVTVLALRDTSLYSWMPALNCLTDRLLAAKKADAEVERELLVLRKKLSDALVMRGRLQDNVNKACDAQAVESAKAEGRSLNMDFLKEKAQETYNKRQGKETQLASRNMKESLSHQALVQLSEEVTALKAEIEPLRKKLQRFMDLIPNPSLARVKIEEAKRELAALDAQMEMRMDSK